MSKHPWVFRQDLLSAKQKPTSHPSTSIGVQISPDNPSGNINRCYGNTQKLINEYLSGFKQDSLGNETRGMGVGPKSENIKTVSEGGKNEQTKRVLIFKFYKR